MKSRSGVPEAKAFGPRLSKQATWRIWPRNVSGAQLEAAGPEGHYVLGVGSSAFEACASVGMTLGQVVHIQPLEIET